MGDAVRPDLGTGEMVITEFFSVFVIVIESYVDGGKCSCRQSRESGER